MLQFLGMLVMPGGRRRFVIPLASLVMMMCCCDYKPTLALLSPMIIASSGGGRQQLQYDNNNVLWRTTTADINNNNNVESSMTPFLFQKKKKNRIQLSMSSSSSSPSRRRRRERSSYYDNHDDNNYNSRKSYNSKNHNSRDYNSRDYNSKDYNSKDYYNNNNNERHDNNYYEQQQPADHGQTGPSHFFSKKSLTDSSFCGDEVFFGLCEKAGITRPSKVQSMAWPVLVQGKHAILADQTGSGKTLAYLVPLLRRALAQKRSKKAGTPSILILAPTAELADQVRAVCSKLSSSETSSGSSSFRCMVVTASGKFSTNIRDQIRMIQRESMDVLISTPGRISTILRTRKSGLDLSQLQSLVLDEVDVLFLDETFGDQLRTVGQAAPVHRTQFVFVTATLPDSVTRRVQKEFASDGVTQIRGPGLHRVAPTVREKLIDVSVPSDRNRDKKYCFQKKAEQLLYALRGNRCQRTLIFCNTVESCRAVENLLNRKYGNGSGGSGDNNNNNMYDIRSYHNAMKPETRNKNLAAFSSSSSLTNQQKPARGGVDSILVCTDRAARGVDFEESPVDHVILFDFPKDPAEYVRRVGRTARAGRTGTSTVFAYGWQLPIARSVMGKQNKKKKRVNDLSPAGYDDEDDEDDEDEAYLGSVKQRRQRILQQQQEERKKTMKKNKKANNAAIKDNIEGGTLWKGK